VKLNEKLVVVLSRRAGASSGELFAVHVEDGTIAAITEPVAGAARLAALGDRTGFALIEPQVVRYTDRVTSAPVKFLSE
jgi:hypothetical protein